MGILGAAAADAEALAERSYDEATLCLVKGEFAAGDIVVSSCGRTHNEAHYVFTSADRKPNMVLSLGRALPVPHSRRADIRVNPATGHQYQEPEGFIQLPTATPAADHNPVGSSAPSRSGVAEAEELDEEDLPVLENETSEEMNLANGQVTAVAMEYCVKQIAFGGKDVIQVYHILPKQVCDCPKHCHQFYGICLRPHAGVFLPDRLVPTWTVAVHFIPRTILMVPLAARDRPIIDQSSMSVILPWYNTIYDPQQASAIPTAPLSPSRSRRLQPLLSKEWPICLVRPHKYVWVNRLQAAEIYSNPYKLRDYVDWNGRLLDKYLFRWYNQNPLEDPIATFGNVSHHQFTDCDQKLAGWRETVKLLPCMVITKCPIDDTNPLWSGDGIRRQHLRSQMIFESREVHSIDAGGVVTIEQHHCLSFGRLVPLPACDDVGAWNIKDKKVNDGQRKTLRILHHAVVHLRLPNTFLVAAVYEDNAIYLFEINHQRGFEKIDNASQTFWDREWTFYGVKLGYFGATVPRGAGLGSVKGKILSIAFDVRDWLEPGPRWPEERRQPDTWDRS